MDFLEHSLGGGKVASQKQFLDNDRKVLRFNTISDDCPYIVHYYLADDTLEVRELHFANNGKDQFPLLLKRSKVPKRFSVDQPGQNDSEQDYLTEADLYPGEPIVAFSRTFHVVGVDEFTNRYFKEKFGRHFDIGSNQEPKAPEAPKIIEPPHNGFGDEEDSRGYVYKLKPKQPKKDFFKYVDNDGKVLRFISKFNTQVPEDVDRRFIISYFLADDSIAIFEPAQKNSGNYSLSHLQESWKENSSKEQSTRTDGTLRISSPPLTSLWEET